MHSTPLPAEHTAGARSDACNQHLVTLLELLHLTANLINNADALMAESAALLYCRDIATNDMEICATDGGSEQLDYGIGSALELWLWLVYDLDFAYAVEY